MTPRLNQGEYVFCNFSSIKSIKPEDIVGTFKEEEGWTIILNKELADKMNYEYSYIASWITLTVNSSLEAVGLTAAFAQALANANISCNVVAAYYHDHIFVAQRDAEKAIKVLRQLSEDNR